jgi:hypothetical protein
MDSCHERMSLPFLNYEKQKLVLATGFEPNYPRWDCMPLPMRHYTVYYEL